MKQLALASVRALQAVSSWVWLIIETIAEAKDSMLRGRAPFRARILFDQADRVGWGSVPLVALVSFFLGLTMALLTGYQLQRYGTERLVPGLIAIAFSRELGPLLTGVMLAARIGAAFTAELGTMRVAEEVEAIEAMGIGPLRLLVAPRLLAVTALMPCLAVVSNLAAILGTYLVSAFSLGISYNYFVDLVLRSLLVRDIVAGVVKSVLFGLIIGSIACHKGLTVRGGAAGVGSATTSSVVVAITTVIGFDSLFNVYLVALFE